MGTAQSTESESPCPLCRALCLRSGQSASKVDEGEWFGDLPRDKSKSSKRRGTGRRKSKSQKKLGKQPSMPPVPEESFGSDTVLTLTSEENGPSPASEDDSSQRRRTAPSGTAGGVAPVESNVQRRSSDPHPEGMKKKKKKKKPQQRRPKAKLTFANGQFVDPTTAEGRGIIAAAGSGDSSGAVGGVLRTVPAGHCGLLASRCLQDLQTSKATAAERKGGENIERKNGGEKAKNKGADGLVGSFSKGMARLTSDSNASSGESASSQGAGAGSGSKDAVSSIAALGEGWFLTSCKSDRVVKLWQVGEDKAGGSTVKLVRDFPGHSTGVSCLAKVDPKGRFLSASKDRAIKLWDSRFNCDDGDGAEEQRYLLATFLDMDRRDIHGIAVTETGQFVRPTDQVDKAMAAAMVKKAIKEGSAAVTKAAQERQIIACSCEFATISGRHNAVKMWSIHHVEPKEVGPPSDVQDVAEVKAGQELKHDAVVESIVATPDKGMLLTGDRMGHVRLWTAGRNVFLPGTAKTAHAGASNCKHGGHTRRRQWSCVRTFSWRLKKDLAKVDEAVQFAITSLTFLQGNTMFASGSKSGNLRVWNLGLSSNTSGETVKKEVICITGAHTRVITGVEQGPQVGDDGSNLSFSSASEDGKVLSFAIPVAKVGSCNPSCFNVVNHGIANRYFVDAEPIGVSALACLPMTGDAGDFLVTGSTNGGSLNLLKRPGPHRLGPKGDALLLYRQAMEEESLTLYDIAEKITKADAVESRNRKLNLRTFKNVFLGEDAVSYLVDNGYAASRKDAVDLGSVLATHLSLFECVTKKCKQLEDDAKSYYRWSSEFTRNEPNMTRSLVPSVM